ncbi:Serine/threonine-protein phosphatase 6 regulatory ankyrin repeat subunit B [Diaporthe eres]|nr:Serine/threonine-protein phosphatase 6 regulatory ankyrin repeat subunit B [Diaporthe eres]
MELQSWVEMSLGLTALGAAALNGQSEMLGWLLGLDTMDVKYHLEIQPRLILQVAVGPDGKKCTLQTPRTLDHVQPRPEGIVAIDRRRTREKLIGRIAMTPLAAAVFNGHDICVNLLLEWMQKHHHEAPAAEWKASCMSSMLYEMQRGHLSIMRTLLPFVDVHHPAPGFNRYTLLHFAILMRNSEAVKLILADQTVDLSAADVDPLAALEALLEGHDKNFTLLCKLFLDCNPGGLLATDSSGYSCFDRIVFNCIREMANAKLPVASFPEEACSTDIEGINALNWTPIPLSKTSSISPFYRDSLEKISLKLLDRNDSPIFRKAGQPDGEQRIGLNSLYLALASCSFGFLRALVQLHPASVCDIDSRGGTILMAAFLRGSQESIDLILKMLEKQKDTTVINSVTIGRKSVLTAAIFNGRVDHPRQFKSLLMFPGFDLRLAFHQNEKGNCPLMSLAILTSRHTVLPLGQVKEDQNRGTPKTCEMMYENCWQLFKAISESVDPKELSDLYLRLSEGLFNRAGLRFIDTLCAMPRPDYLELFLQSCPALRSQLHTPDAKGMTPLMHASKAWRHHETIMFLLKTSEVDVGHRDEQGRTALSHVAENMGQFFDGGLASKLIEEFGQDALVVDNHGWSPLRYAVANGNVWEGSPYHRLLQDSDAPMDWTDEQGSNPPHLAIKGCSIHAAPAG